jgi:pyruvate dehydrogenase E2 component (dihydrolipoamide acetyltransferase)
MSDTMSEGVIAAWHKKVGDPVKSGELLAEIETDKATMEYESYNTGTLLYVGAEPGKAVAVNGVLAIIGEKGADYQTLLKAHEAKTSGGGAPAAEKNKEVKAEAAQPTATAATSHESGNGRIKASPLAKKLAKDKGFDISKIQGSGDFGRVTKRDVENYKPSAETTAPAQKGAAPVMVPVGQESFEEINVSQMRKTICH